MEARSRSAVNGIFRGERLAKEYTCYVLEQFEALGIVLISKKDSF